MAPSNDTFAQERARMVETQLIRRGIRDARVLAAMGTVPREAFVPKDKEDEAYFDGPLPIGQGQTISQPYIVACMVEALELTPGARVLEIGTGSGYGAAILSRIAHDVISVERLKPLADKARKTLQGLKYDNVAVICADGTLGYPPGAPYDAIVATAGGPQVPETLKQQLKTGGRLVIPVGGSRMAQNLVRIRRTGETTFTEETLEPVRFVPLIGAEGWQD
jgi:protein-L-isoaspartate(D-aspartate) O-methyltransferase